MNTIDLFVQHYFLLARTPGFTELFYLLTTLFDFTIPFVLISVCVASLVYIVRSGKYAALFLFSLGFSGALVYLLKWFFNVARPLGGVVDVLGQSFPSGHTTIVTVFFIMLMYIFDSHFKTVGRIIFNTFCIGRVILVSFSRLSLGVHWVSDVIGGVFLGGIISYASVLFSKRFLVK